MNIIYNKGGNMKYIYLGLAFLFLIIGAIGVVLPVLPTTPFLLLASYFFGKGSKRVQNWFLSTKLYKNHLDSFVKSKAMTMKTKISILIPASLMLILAFIITGSVHARIFILAVMIFKYYYFTFKIKTINA